MESIGILSFGIKGDEKGVKFIVRLNMIFELGYGDEYGCTATIRKNTEEEIKKRA